MEFCSAQSLLQFYARRRGYSSPCLPAYELLFEIFGKGYLTCLAKSIANSSSHDLLPIFNGLDYSSVREMQGQWRNFSVHRYCSYRIDTNDPQRSPAQRD